MSEALNSLRKRLDRLMRDEFSPPSGVVRVPMHVAPELWSISVLISEVVAVSSYAQPVQCDKCFYPMLPASSCVACDVVRRPEPRSVVRWPRSGTAKIPFDWRESQFLHQVQFAWCVTHGARVYDCETCERPLASNQVRCLVCYDRWLRNEES